MIGFVREELRKLNIKATGSVYESSIYDELIKTRSWACWWAANTLVNLAVYYRNSIGRGSTYCNISAYDFFDSRCELVWNVEVNIGKSIKNKYPMGNVIRAFDFDITPILKDRKLKTVLSTTPHMAYQNALKAEKKKEVRLLSSREAYEKAKKGIPSMVIHPGLGSRMIGHLAIVIPDFAWQKNSWKLGKYNEALGCRIANVGFENGIMHMDDPRGFGYYLNPDTLKLLRGKKGKNVPAIIVEFRDYNTKNYLEV